jgi:hypothetical protein
MRRKNEAENAELFKVNNENGQAIRQLEEHNGKLSAIHHHIRELIHAYLEKTEGQIDNPKGSRTVQAVKKIIADALEAASLRSELQSLQSYLLGMTHRWGCAPDEDFRRAFSMLTSSIKSFSRSIRIHPEFDLKDIQGLHEQFLVAKVPER